MSRVLVVAHHERTEAAALAQMAITWLTERDHHAWLTPADALALGLTELQADDPPESADLLLSLGGDGTMLRAVQLLAGSPIPIIGVNVGLLGYLAEIEPTHLITALELGQSRLKLRLKLTHAQRDLLVGDAKGDALDAVLCLMQAAWAQTQHAAGAVNYGLPANLDPLEGWIVTA